MYKTDRYLLNGLFSRTTLVSRHQKGQTNLILMKQEMMGWQWHQLDHMQIYAPHTRQIFTFYGPDALHDAQQSGWLVEV